MSYLSYTNKRLTYNNHNLWYVSSAGYDADLLTYISGLSTPLSTAQLTKINTFIVDLKAGLGITSLSEVFDVMYYLGNETAESSLRNMVKRAHDATAVSSPTFTVYEGWMGNGSSSYIDTNYNPNTEGSNFTLNNASLGVYCRTNADTINVCIGHYSASAYTFMRPRYSNASIGHINGSGTGYSTVANTDSRGMFINTRNGATALDIYMYINKTSSQNHNGSGGTAGIPNNNIFICARNDNGSVGALDGVHQLSLAFAGEHITTEMRDTIYDTFQALMTANGKQV